MRPPYLLMTWQSISLCLLKSKVSQRLYMLEYYVLMSYSSLLLTSVHISDHVCGAPTLILIEALVPPCRSYPSKPAADQFIRLTSPVYTTYIHSFDQQPWLSSLRIHTSLQVLVQFELSAKPKSDESANIKFAFIEHSTPDTNTTRRDF